MLLQNRDHLFEPVILILEEREGVGGLFEERGALDVLGLGHLVLGLQGAQRVVELVNPAIQACA